MLLLPTIAEFDELVVVELSGISSIMSDSPTKLYSSDSDLSVKHEGSLHVNLRKRKQPESELLEAFSNLQMNVTKMLKDFRDEITTNLNTHQTEIKTELESIKTEQIKIKQQITAVAGDVSNLQQSSEFMSAQQQDLEKIVNDCGERLDRLEKETTDVKALEAKIDMLEQQARQCNLELMNVPERRNENLINIVESIGKQISCNLNRHDIVAVHRVPHASQNNKPKNIIVKLSSRILRDNILSAFRLKKGLTSTDIGISGTKSTIFINEHLTLMKKHLFRAAREAAKKEKFKYVWVKHASILVRESDTSPIMAIRTAEDIPKIKGRPA